jgi:hypothetical protein
MATIAYEAQKTAEKISDDVLWTSNWSFCWSEFGQPILSSVNPRIRRGTE